MKYAAPFFAAMLLAGCASAPPPPQIVVQTKLVMPNIDPDLLSCGDAPNVPVHPAMQSDAAHYLVALWAWGNECRSHLDAVRQSLSINVSK